MKAADIARMWVNQPSTLQPLHSLHGTNVLAAPEGEGLFRIWFLAGEVVSQQAPRAALSSGWRS
jgi:streptomycin 6-kinase